MDVTTFIRMANRFASMGDSVTEQAHAVICESADIGEMNPNAMSMVVEFLHFAAEDLERQWAEEASEFREMAEDLESQMESAD